MSYYNPISWISSDDQLISDIEQKLVIYKRASSRGLGSGKYLSPPSAMELAVIVEDTQEILRLTEWEDRQGKIFINLTFSEDTYRKGHFNTGWHHNPSCNDIRPPHHIHFPTVKYPKIERPITYAYPVNCDSDYLSALRKFCDDTNIELRGASIPLLRR